jgi:hypothetical protein
MPILQYLLTSLQLAFHISTMSIKKKTHIKQLFIGCFKFTFVIFFRAQLAPFDLELYCTNTFKRRIIIQNDIIHYQKVIFNHYMI